MAQSMANWDWEKGPGLEELKRGGGNSELTGADRKRGNMTVAGFEIDRTHEFHEKGEKRIEVAD